MKNYFIPFLAAVLIMASCEKEVEVSSVKLNQNSSELYLDSTLQLEATISPSNATNAKVIWISSDKSTATVDQNGLVTATGVGIAEITASVGSISDICAVKVLEKPEVEVDKVTLNKTSLNLHVGDVFELKAEVSPADAENKDIEWESSAREIAKVDKYGKVLAVAEGTAVIKAKAGDKEAECRVTVSNVKVESVTLNKTSLELQVEETFKLTATVKPENAYEKTVYWKSSSDKIATVDVDGNVKAIAEGEAIIKATAGNVTAECKVIVKPIPVKGIFFEKSDLQIMIGDRVDLVLKLEPENAVARDILWSSSDPAIASVENGTVTGHKLGSAVITAKVDALTAKCNITVNPVQPKIGDYYYSDGTYSSVLNTSKTPVGLIFYLGDPTVKDPALKKDYPDCTHGLVVSLDQDVLKVWQEKEKDYTSSTYKGFVGKWISKNTSFISCTAQGKADEAEHAYFNSIIGYNNTKAIEAFNAAPENAKWPVDIVNKVVEYRTKVKTPAGASAWYVPSIKELSLMCSGKYDGNIDDIKGLENPLLTGVRDLLDKQLSKLTGKAQFGENSIWSSTEDGGEYSGYAFKLIFRNGKTLSQEKNSSEKKYDLYTRFVFAF